MSLKVIDNIECASLQGSIVDTTYANQPNVCSHVCLHCTVWDIAT